MKPNPPFSPRQGWLPFTALLLLLLVAGVALFTLLPKSAQPHSSKTAATAGDTDRAAGAVVVPSSWGQRIATATTENFRELIRQALEIPDPELRQRVVADLIAAWLNHDAQDFGKYLSSIQVHTAADDPLRRLVFSALGDALTRLTRGAAESDSVLAIIGQYVAELARTQPDEALRWAREWLLADALDAALVTIAREFARRNPQQGIEVARTAGADLRRMQAFYAVGGIWAQTAPQEALTWAASLSAPTERAMVLNSVLLSVARQDPQYAATQLAEFQLRMADEYAQNRRATLAAMGITEADEANDAENYRELLEAGAIAGPVSPDIELMAGAGRVIAARLAETDPATAIAWTDALRHDFLRVKSVAGLLDGWARTAPQDALAFQQMRYPQSTELLTSLFDSWAANSATAAAAAARTLPDPAKRQRALESVVSSWVLQEDASVVANWLDTLPAAEKSDAMTASVAAAMSNTTPEQSWQRALSIRNDAERYRALKAAFSVLVSERPQVARNLLASTPLATKHHERLSEMLRAVGAEK